MRRAIGSHLIRLAYRICPPLKAELQHAVEMIACSSAQTAAEQAAHDSIALLLQHQQRAARIAARQ